MSAASMSPVEAPASPRQSPPPKRSAIGNPLSTLALLVPLGALVALCVKVIPDRPYWLDEVMTVLVARRPDMSSFWHALATGPMADPPLYYLATRAVALFTGHSPIAMRVPSAVGVVLACLCLYVFTARRVAAPYARLAVWFLLTSLALRYATEARPYGLWIGMSALALLCWQSAGEADRKWTSVVGLALAVCGCILTHYFSVLVVASLGLAELARSWERRRIDLPVWVALGISIVPLMACRSLMANASDYSYQTAAPPLAGRMLDIYGWLNRPTSLSLLVAFIAIPTLFRIPPDRREPVEDSSAAGTWSDGPPFSEIVAALALTAMPQTGFLLSMVVTNTYQPRHVLPTLCGMAVLLSFGAYRVARERRVFADLLSVCLILLTLSAFKSEYQSTRGPKPGGELEATLQARPDKTVPLLLVSDYSQKFFVDYYYRPDPACQLVDYAVLHSVEVLNRKAHALWDFSLVEPADVPRLERFYLVPTGHEDTLGFIGLLRKAGAKFTHAQLLDGGSTMYLVEIARDAVIRRDDRPARPAAPEKPGP